MFDIEKDNPTATIANALKAIDSTKQTELANRLGLKNSGQLSTAKKAGQLSDSLMERFKELREALKTSSPTITAASPCVVNIAIEHLQADDSIQQRVQHINEATVDAYVEAATDGWPFPPIIVYRDVHGKYWLADGFHRVKTALALGHDQIPAHLEAGERADALLYAAGANATHGLPRTNADKRKAVETVLDLPTCMQWTDREIARQCKVSHPFVAKVRESFDTIETPLKAKSTGNVSSQTASSPPKQSVRKTANGRTINTTNITKANKARAKTPAKEAQQAIHRFGGSCTDLRAVDLKQTEVFKVAELCRDQLIWCVPHLAEKDVQAMLLKLETAMSGVKGNA